jgi:hypothetical protein
MKLIKLLSEMQVNNPGTITTVALKAGDMEEYISDNMMWVGCVFSLEGIQYEGYYYKNDIYVSAEWCEPNQEDGLLELRRYLKQHNIEYKVSYFDDTIEYVIIPGKKFNIPDKSKFSQEIKIYDEEMTSPSDISNISNDKQKLNEIQINKPGIVKLKISHTIWKNTYDIDFKLNNIDIEGKRRIDVLKHKIRFAVADNNLDIFKRNIKVPYTMIKKQPDHPFHYVFVDNKYVEPFKDLK